MSTYYVLVDFIGADQASPSRYNRRDVLRVVRPHLEELRRYGCRRLIECTPNFLGRDPRLLKQLAGDTGIEVWTNTGLYGAGQNYKFLPAYARQETAEQLAARWIEEATRGVDGIRPRFIKIGIGQTSLGEWDRKLVRAAAITSRATDFTIASHTPTGAAAAEQLEILTAERVAPAKFVWVHAQNEKDHNFHRKLAEAGAWVEFDGIGPKSAYWHRDCIEFMGEAGLLGRTLISQDAGWYHVGEPGGGDFRPYTYIYTHFGAGLDDGLKHQLLVQNPEAAFGK
ncbi:MAG: phosphotriesterase [Bryobacteraceae bacterium]